MRWRASVALNDNTIMGGISFHNLAENLVASVQDRNRVLPQPSGWKSSIDNIVPYLYSIIVY